LPPSSTHGVLHSFPTRRSSDLGLHPCPARSRFAAIEFETLDTQSRIISGKLLQHIPGFIGAAIVGDHNFIAQRERVERRMNCCQDRKSTRLNSSHVSISYAVLC